VSAGLLKKNGSNRVVLGGFIFDEPIDQFSKSGNRPTKSDPLIPHNFELISMFQTHNQKAKNFKLQTSNSNDDHRQRRIKSQNKSELELGYSNCN
jgi:hypothetical protein